MTLGSLSLAILRALRSPPRPAAPRRSPIGGSPLRAGALGGRTGPRQRFDDAHRAGELQAARLPHFTHHENLLAAILVHRDANLRILQEPPLARRSRSSFSTACTLSPPAFSRPSSGNVNVPSAWTMYLPGQLRLVEDRDRQHVVRHRRYSRRRQPPASSARARATDQERDHGAADRIREHVLSTT